MPLVRRGPGLIGAAARTAVVAGTATAVSGRVARRQQNRWAAEEQPQQEAQAYAPQAAEPDYASELEQLAQLKTQGIITEDEFEAKKKQILGI
jgi:hypothetical protein